LYAPHINEYGIFFNPWLTRERTQKSGSWLFHKRVRYGDFPENQYSKVDNDYSYLSDNNFNSITFAGHASMIVKMNSQIIFTDPFFSNSAFLAPKKEKIKFNFDKVPEKPVVLISHNHYDHLDKYSVKQLVKKNAVFIVPLGLKKIISDYGGKTVHELDWWQSIKLDEVEYTLVPAQHWSRRIGQAGGAVLWGGFIIQGSKTIYFSGDTGYFIGFKEFGRLWDIDYAIMGAGAYEPRWFMHYSHMNVSEFLKAVSDINAKCAIPMHFGIISLSDEPLLYPLYEIENAVNKDPELAGIIHPMRVGQYVKMP
jgi:L-ascorbate metabolism protein UlaG (beta-lactamase superfamily)